ncbi:transcription antitermination protein [Haloarcula montana]|uniref:transcription antitermination protein n=1 Tax=Haloarcula montana TaxID=3111776 RepID=UPI002D78342E|nr:transcription antitermination protein [Haloarcula sp. GH36]
MDADGVISTVRDEQATELDRLGSDKALIAATGATLEADAVREAAATREHALASALDDWSDETDGAIGAAFAAAADGAAERARRLDAPSGAPDAFGEYLGQVTGTPERVGAGLVAAPLVLDRFYLQVVSFFVNEADERGAALARELRTAASDLEGARNALGVLATEDRELVQNTAVEAISVAYTAYADALTEMGLDPKPIC